MPFWDVLPQLGSYFDQGYPSLCRSTGQSPGDSHQLANRDERHKRGQVRRPNGHFSSDQNCMDHWLPGPRYVGTKKPPFGWWFLMVPRVRFELTLDGV